MYIATHHLFANDFQPRKQPAVTDMYSEKGLPVE